MFPKRYPRTLTYLATKFNLLTEFSTHGFPERIPHVVMCTVYVRVIENICILEYIRLTQMIYYCVILLILIKYKKYGLNRTHINLMKNTIDFII